MKCAKSRARLTLPISGDTTTGASSSFSFEEFREHRHGGEFVDGDFEEALDLTGVEVYG